jgi:putative monooxygenase
MGEAVLEAGEYVAEHYHPYSEEFIYLVSGHVRMRMNGELVDLLPGDALLITPNTRHRLENAGDENAVLVYHLGPLAPRPELGHVDTEDAPQSVGTRAQETR